MVRKKIDYRLLVINLIKMFKTISNIQVGKNAKKLLVSETDDDYSDESIKIYYMTYSLKLVDTLRSHVSNITAIDIPNNYGTFTDAYTLILTSDDDNITVEIGKNMPVLKDIIPDKLMKICKYQGNSNVSKKYKPEYKQLNDKIYSRLSKKYDKYSDISQEKKDIILYEPFVDLFISSLVKKRKCAQHLYNHIITFEPKLLIITRHNNYELYDFTKISELGDNPSFRLKKIDKNSINITFNNNFKFRLVLHSNATNINQHLSLKYHITFVNVFSAHGLAKIEI